MREWFAAAELIGLPGLPTDRGSLSRRASREEWLARAREGQGGGREFHVSNLPPEARAALVLRERPPAESDQEAPLHLWDEWDSRPGSVKEEAERRFAAVVAVQELVDGGAAKMAAYRTVAAQTEQSVATVRRWYGMVQDVPRGDWLPTLAPSYAGRVATAEYDDRVYEWFRDLYLDSSRPPYTRCYERVCRIAEAEGLEVPSLSTLKRELERREDPAIVVLEREGEAAAKRLFPYLQRSRAGFRAMEALNADGHVLDLDTIWPDGERCRTTLIGFQDLYSGTIVGWRLAKSESAHELGIAFLDVCDDYGVCDRLWVDNTLAMASKRMTAGAKGRKRFKDREGDPLGVLPQLGVEVRWVMPRSGQSKPIERAFRDLTDRISKHPAFSGAYLGNNPVNKPHDYGTRTVTVEEVAAIAKQEILAHNLQEGRRTDACRGRLSFWQAFERSYEEHSASIRRLTTAQRRLLYLVADTVTVRKDDSCIHLFGNRYWSEDLVRFRGRKVVVRYHPTERTLHDEVYAYALSGEFIGAVPCYQKAGFEDAAAAREHNRARRQYVREKRKAAKARRRMEAAEVAGLVPELEAPELAAAGGEVIRPAFGILASIERAVDRVEKREREQDDAQARAMSSLERAAARLEQRVEKRKQA